MEPFEYMHRKWRVGRKLGRTLYAIVGEPEPIEHDILLGMVDTPEIAAHVVEIHNKWLRG